MERGKEIGVYQCKEGILHKESRFKRREGLQEEVEEEEEEEVEART